jgi:hypothetical protein
MRNVLPLKVPVVVDVEVGESWGELEKMINDKLKSVFYFVLIFGAQFRKLSV